MWLIMMKWATNFRSYDKIQTNTQRKKTKQKLIVFAFNLRAKRKKKINSHRKLRFHWSAWNTKIQMNAHRNSIPRLKFYDTQHLFHHEYFSSRHNSSAAIMTTSNAGSVTGALSPVSVCRRPDIIKVCWAFSFSRLFVHLSSTRVVYVFLVSKL